MAVQGIVHAHTSMHMMVQEAMLLHEIKAHNGWIGRIAISSDSQHITTSGMDRTLKMWRADTGEQMWVIDVPDLMHSCMDMSKEGRLLAAGAYHESEGRHHPCVMLWGLARGKAPKLIRVMMGHASAMRVIKFSPDGKKLAGGTEDGVLIVWSVQSGEVLMSHKLHRDHIYCLAWTSDSKAVASAGCSLGVAVRDAESGAQLVDEIACGGSVFGATFGSQSDVLVVCGSFTGILVFDELQRGKAATLRHRLEGHEGSVQSVALSPDDRHVASGGDDKTLRVWEAATGQQIRVIEGIMLWAQVVVWSPDGSYLVSGGADALRVWRVKLQVRVCVWLIKESTSLCYVRTDLRKDRCAFSMHAWCLHWACRSFACHVFLLMQSD